jgi:hypothetical protein
VGRVAGLRQPEPASDPSGADPRARAAVLSGRRRARYTRRRALLEYQQAERMRNSRKALPWPEPTPAERERLKIILRETLERMGRLK